MGVKQCVIILYYRFLFKRSLIALYEHYEQHFFIYRLVKRENNGKKMPGSLTPKPTHDGHNIHTCLRFKKHNVNNAKFHVI